MPRSEQEVRAIRLAKEKWGVYAGCECTPEDIPEGKGYELECPHKHVEVKGTNAKSPGFRYLTRGEFDAARTDPLFELWLVTDIGDEGVFHIVPREDVVSLCKIEIWWDLRLGKKRLVRFREIAEERERRGGNA